MSYNSKYKSSEIEEILDSVEGKQDTLVSGTNIKTINGNSLLGSGDIVISGSGGSGQSAFKRGIVEQTQTWTKAADGGYDYAMSNLVEGDIPIANIDLFAASGAVFNEETGYFELNGLVDISYKEIMTAYLYRSNLNSRFLYAGAKKLRTCFKNSGQTSGASIEYMFQNTDVEVTPADIYRYYANVSIYCLFSGCKYLKEIGNIIHNPSNTNLMFRNCESLEKAYIQNLGINVDISYSPNFLSSCVASAINNAIANKTFTITLHPTAYARAIADASVQAALEAHTNVTLASA